MEQDNDGDNEDDYIYESDVDSVSSSSALHTTTTSSVNRRSSSTLPSPGPLALYTVLNQDAVKREQERMIADISELFRTSAFESRRLLMDFRWNKEELTNALFSKGTDALLKSAGVGRFPLAHSSSQKPPSQCLICADDVDASSCVTNPTCGHTFCASCWGHHVRVKLEENQALNLRCMMDKCGAVITPEVMAALSLSPGDVARYEKGMLDSFVDVNPRVTWCPSHPCCGRAIRVSDISTSRIDCECTCEEVFCFSCSSASHSPTPCEWAKNWQALCEAESANAMYIARNCKPCPKCGKNIFKQDGCNHVTCTCGQSMCWLCGAATGKAHDWNSIQGHTCSKFRLQSETEAAAARIKMDKYIHYFEKYNGHMQSFKMAAMLKSKVDKTIGELEGTNNALVDWLSIGLYQLLRMRCYLAWSYAMAYYAFYDANLEKLKKAFGNAVNAEGVLHAQGLFEDLQANLHKSVERLSKLVEMPAMDMTKSLMSNKTEVLNLCSFTHTNAVALNDFVINELFAKGVFGLDDPPAYFPIRRMVTGLGVSMTAAPLSVSLGGTVGASPKTINTTVATKKHPEIVNLTLSDEDDQDEEVQLVLEGSMFEPSRKQQRA